MDLWLELLALVMDTGLVPLIYFYPPQNDVIKSCPPSEMVV